MDHLIVEKSEDTVTVFTVMHPRDAIAASYGADTLFPLAPHLGRTAFLHDHGVEMGKANEGLLSAVTFEQMLKAHKEHDRLWALQEEYSEEVVRKLGF